MWRRGLPDGPQYHGVVVHHQYRSSGLPAVLRAGGTASCTTGRVKANRAPKAWPTAPGMDAAPVGLHYPLADGQPETGVAHRVLILLTGEFSEWEREATCSPGL